MTTSGVKYFFVLIWITYLICSGVFLFSRGFLLSRVAKQEISTCRHLSNNENEEYYLNDEIVKEIFKNVNASSSLCLPKKSKVIIIVIDALKFDFGRYNENLLNPLPYENKLTIFNDLLTSQPENSRLLKFIADPPTTTMQRLKGLTTGSLPTFIDIGSNFASPEINEDNIIDQIVRNNYSAVFLGDATWTELYPNRFKRHYSYPSFDIFDLDTVDNEIMRNLPKELENKDWDLLVAHFLGVDHCGHRYGPLHNEMSRKLNEMNNVLKLIIEKMDNDSTLLVIGDHGMTITGDHGGETDDEIDALLFAYSKSHKFLTSDFGSDNTTLKQIDIVPTLATIFGVPIPYSNLGLINFNIIPDVQVPHMLKHQALQLHSWQNAKQIHNYFYNYAMENSRTFSFDNMDDMENNFFVLTQRANTIYTEAAFKNFIIDLNQFLRTVLNICRNIWVKFDANQMSQGLLLTFLPIFFSFLLIHNSRAQQFSQIFTQKLLSSVYLFNFAAGVFGYRFYKELSMRTELHGIIFTTGILSTILLAFLTLQNWPEIAINWNHTKRFNNMATRCIFLITISIFFSNSFIIQEQKILSYLLIALLIIIMYNILYDHTRQNIGKNVKFKLRIFLKSSALKLIICGIFAICFIRFSFMLFRCREEQGNCGDFQTNHTNNTTKLSNSTINRNNSKFYLLSVMSLIVYTSLTRLYLRSCGNLTGFSINVILARYGPTIGAICTGGHILLSESSIKNIKISHLDGMAWVVYFLLFTQIIIILTFPLMTYVLPPRSSTQITINQYANVVPEIFKKIKKSYEGDQNDRKSEIPVVYGLATVYSATLISFGLFLGLTLILLLNARASLGLTICIGVAAVLLILHSVLRYSTAKSLESCMQPTFTATVAWFLIAHFCFFATSHQTTLSQIDWHAAFIGRSSKFDHSNVLSAILVILNTFCGQIYFLTLYGLLCSETFSLYALFPSLKVHQSQGLSSDQHQKHQQLPNKEIKETKNHNNHSSNNNIRATTVKKTEINLSSNEYYSNDFDITRGELILYENENVYFGCLFKCATQLFMLQGLKIFCSMMACTIHCRHLMVWKIFAPRFIYEGLSTFVGMTSILLGYLIIIRIHWSVNRLISKINKIK